MWHSNLINLGNKISSTNKNKDDYTKKVFVYKMLKNIE